MRNGRKPKDHLDHYRAGLLADLLKLPVGSALWMIDQREAVVGIHEVHLAIARLPNPCPVELRLASWLTGRIYVIAWMVQLARLPDYTYSTWVNAGHPYGALCLDCILQQRELPVRVFTDSTEPAAGWTMPNVLHRAASHLLLEAQRHLSEYAWSAWEFADAVYTMQQRARTPHALWLKATAERWGSVG